MLELMRKHAKNWIMKLLLGIIIVVFVFYFGSLRERDQTDVIAEIDGKAIYYIDFQREYEQLINVVRERFGRDLTDSQLKVFTLKEQAVDNLVKQAIVIKKAEELGIRVSDEEVGKAILSYPAFQRDGKFDQRLYEQTLRSNRMAPENFEAQQQTLLVTKKLQELIFSGVHVSERDVFDLYRLQSEKINVRFIKLASKDCLNKVKPPERQALEDYLKEHSGEFRIPEQFQVKYLYFSASDYLLAVKITEDEVRDYYERNKERMAEQGKKPPAFAETRGRIAAELRRVSAMGLAVGEAKKAHDTIYQQENFDGYASGKGLKIHTSPLFPASRVPSELSAIAEFSDNALSLHKDERSKVLSNGSGYYLFQMIERKPAYIPALKDVEKAVERRYLENEARLLCGKEAEKLLERLKQGEELEKIAREKKIKVEETGMFLPGSAMPDLGLSEQLNDALMQLSDKKPYPDKALQMDDNFLIIRFKERGRLDEEDFRSKKEELKIIFTELKRNETINTWIEGVKNSLIKEGRLKIVRDIK